MASSELKNPSTGSNQPLRILLLADSLPDPHSPDPQLRLKNIFVLRQARKLARFHQVTHPVLVPRLAGAIRLAYKLRGRSLSFPAPRNEILEGIHCRTVRYTYLPRLYPALKARALLRHLEAGREKFDLAHCHAVYDLGLAGLELKKRLGLPLVVTVHGTDVNWLFEEVAGVKADERIAEATRKVLNEADAVIPVSRALSKRVELLGVSADKIHWIANGVEAELFVPGDKYEERIKLGLDQREKIILYAGAILETKGLGDLARALKILTGQADSRPGVRLLLVGPDGGYQAALRGLAGELRVAEKITFTGAKDYTEVPSYMRAADVFCLPSWREGWPCAVHEAFACGLPVVACEVGGVPEMLSGPELGTICPPHEPERLAEALRAALERDWDTAKLTAAAEPYSYDRLRLKYEEVYRAVLEGRNLEPSENRA